jgi:CRISPR-associated protein Csh1
MIYDIYRVGKAVSGYEEEMEPLLRPDMPKNIAHVIWINIGQIENDVDFSGIEVLEYSKNTPTLSLLRKSSSNGTNYGPSAQVTEIEKTLTKKIVPWFKEAAKDSKRAEEQKVLSAIYDLLLIYKEDIIRIINEKTVRAKKVSYMISVKLNEKVPYKVPMFFHYYEKKVRKKIVGEDDYTGTCCLCGKKDVGLVPKLNVFKFYTLDKPGFVSGGFREEDVWRNCPVCISCEPVLREGKKYVLNNLHFKFFGLDYYLIPSSTCGEMRLELLLSRLLDITNKNFSLKETAENEFQTLSGDIFEELSEQEDINSYRVLFFHQKKSEERILLDIKDVFPSRFSVLYSAKHKLEAIYEEMTGEKFTFQYFRNYLSKSEPNSKVYDLNSNFLALTQAIFKRQKVSLQALLPFYMNNIRREFLNNNKYFFYTVIRAWIGVQYLQEIGCMIFEEGESKMDAKLETVLKPYSIGLDDDIKKALVLTGVLVQKVMNIQAKDLDDSSPFFNRLKGLKMREADVKGVIKEALKLMQEYKRFSNASKMIFEAVMELIFNTSPDKWGLSTDELNFYIAGGMTLSRKIYDQLKEEQ